jgi:hypothetical protein
LLKQWPYSLAGCGKTHVHCFVQGASRTDSDFFRSLLGSIPTAPEQFLPSKKLQSPGPPPRPQRWAAAVAALLDLQDEYRAWLDNLPTSLEGSRLAEKLQIIVELDLQELHAIETPRGYGRD